MKTKTAPSPATTPEACAKYGARSWECSCPDRTNRGGSHFDERTHEKVCKHMLAIRTGAIDSNAVRCIERGMTPEQLTAEAAQLCRQMGTGKDIIPTVTVTPAAPAAESLAAMKQRRADLETQLEEVSYRLDMLQPVDEEEAGNANYFIIGSLMSEIDDIMGDLETLDRKIAQAVQAEAVAEAELQTEIETAQADQEFAVLIAEINDDLDDTLTPEELAALMTTRKAERKLGGPARRCMDRSGILEPAKPTSATDALLAAISPQLMGQPIRRHG